jgi:hypothetical protein
VTPGRCPPHGYFGGGITGIVPPAGGWMTGIALPVDGGVITGIRLTRATLVLASARAAASWRSSIGR